MERNVFGLSCQQIMFRVNVWYPSGTSMLKKERKKEKVRTFQQQCIAEGVCFSVSLIKIGGTKYF